jgi:predicted nucleotidyltransferase
MLDIDKVKSEIIRKLKPLNPDKVILFGSYAYGSPNSESDIDLFLIKDDLLEDNFRSYTLKARKLLREIIFKYNTNGIDIISASSNFLQARTDYFYKIDILQNGEVLYERKVS